MPWLLSFTFLLLQHLCPERDQFPGVRGGRGAIDFGVGDEPAEKHVNVNAFAAEVVAEQHRLCRRNYRVVVSMEEEDRRGRWGWGAFGRRRRIGLYLDVWQQHRTKRLDVAGVHVGEICR